MAYSRCSVSSVTTELNVTAGTNRRTTAVLPVVLAERNSGRERSAQLNFAAVCSVCSPRDLSGRKKATGGGLCDSVAASGGGPNSHEAPSGWTC